MSTLDFNKVKKRYLTIKFTDGQAIMVTTPTKAQIESLEEMQTNSANQDINDVFNLSANLMSRNKGGVKITKEYLESVLDYEEITLFLVEYMKFVQGIAAEKN